MLGEKKKKKNRKTARAGTDHFSSEWSISCVSRDIDLGLQERVQSHALPGLWGLQHETWFIVLIWS